MQNIFIEKVVDYHNTPDNFNHLNGHLTSLSLDTVFDLLSDSSTLRNTSTAEELHEIELIRPHAHLLTLLKEKIDEINQNYFLFDGFAFFFVPSETINHHQKAFFIRNRVWLDEDAFKSFQEEFKEQINQITQLKNEIRQTIPFYSSWENKQIIGKVFQVENLNFNDFPEIVKFAGEL